MPGWKYDDIKRRNYEADLQSLVFKVDGIEGVFYIPGKTCTHFPKNF